MADSTEIIVKIADLSRGGAGVARDESGRVIFVPFTAPGDRVRVRILEETRRYAQAQLLEVLEPSPIRRTPPCPVFGRCGGCEWQHIPYDIQWETKFKGVLHGLERVQVPLPGAPDLMPAEQIWNYRNRIQLRGFGEEIGFFAARSHDRVPIEECKVARPEINRALPEARVEGRSLSRPYKVEIEVLDDGSVRKNWNTRHAAGGFRQIHDPQNEKLRAWVTERLAPITSPATSPVSEDARVLDLFGGTGNLGAPVSLRLGPAGVVDCVDLSAPEGTRLPGFPRLHFHRSPVLKWVLRRGKEARYDAAILDPPREGLGEDFGEIASSLEQMGARAVVAVGCEPDAWARDVSRWSRRGWKLSRVGILDLFPQTAHVESLALLIR